MPANFRPSLLMAATTALLSALALALIWGGQNSEQQDRATGDLLADLAARASIDGLIAQDRIELGVVANRLTRVPRVAGVAIFTVENELMALSGNVEEGSPFIQPIVLDDTLIGFASIGLVPPASAPDLPRLAWSALALFCIALLVAWWFARPGGDSPRSSPETAAYPDSATEATSRFLLIGSLHNQLSLSAAERTRTENRALAVARQVGEIYGCRSVHLPGRGLLLIFPVREDHDSAFEAVCAAFLVADRLADDAANGNYRFGMHVVALQPGETPSDHPTALEDAALLAAMSKPGAIVASESFFAHLAEPGRLVAETLSHPMLEQLHDPGRRGHLIAGLDEEHRALLDRQINRLATDFPST